MKSCSRASAGAIRNPRRQPYGFSAGTSNPQLHQHR
jgi:hypothetical protein